MNADVINLTDRLQDKIDEIADEWIDKNRLLERIRRREKSLILEREALSDKLRGACSFKTEEICEHPDREKKAQKIFGNTDKVHTICNMFFCPYLGGGEQYESP